MLAEGWSKAGISVGTAQIEKLERPLSANLYPVELMGRGLGEVQSELKWFPFRLADDVEAGEVPRIQLGELRFTPPEISAYILRQVIEVQGAVDHLEVGPRTLTATANRVAVGNDGDYFSKPNREDIFAAAYAIMRERRPHEFPPIGPAPLRT